jgi:hypothetical protein
LRVSCPVPILPFRCLPTQERPRIVLDGVQGIDFPNARIDHVAHAPILHYAIGRHRGLPRWLPPRKISGQILAVGATAKKAKHAKNTQRQSGCGKNFSHDGSPIVSVQYWTNGHITCRILSSAGPMSYWVVLARFVDYIILMFNTLQASNSLMPSAGEEQNGW